MLKKEVVYVDYNGNDVKENLYFNLTSVEQARLVSRYATKGIDSIESYAKYLVENDDNAGMIAFIEDVILSSFGEKSADGRSFLKTKAIREQFEYSIAYATLFEELVTDEAKMKAFVTAIMQKNENRDKPQNTVEVVN